MSWQFRGRQAIVEDMLAARRAQAAPEAAPAPIAAPDGPPVAGAGPVPYVLPPAGLRTRPSVPVVVQVAITDRRVLCGCWPRYVAHHECESGDRRG